MKQRRLTDIIERGANGVGMSIQSTATAESGYRDHNPNIIVLGV